VPTITAPSQRPMDTAPQVTLNVPTPDEVYMCFHVAEKGESQTFMGSVVKRAVMYFGEKYDHIEVLFLWRAMPKDPRSWRALTAFPATGCQLYQRSYEYYRSEAWALFKINGLSAASRTELYSYAINVSVAPREYNFGGLVNTVAMTSWITPVAACLCLPVASDGSRMCCVELAMDMLVNVFPEKYKAYNASAMRPDALLAAIRKESGVLQITFKMIVNDTSSLHLTGKNQ